MGGLAPLLAPVPVDQLSLMPQGPLYRQSRVIEGPRREYAASWRLLLGLAATVVATLVGGITAPPARAIIGGHLLASPVEAPFLAFLWSYGPPPRYADNYECSGVLVGPDVVLTAAHCTYGDHGRRIPPTYFHIFLGAVRDWASDVNDLEQERIGASVLVDPRYNNARRASGFHVTALVLNHPAELTTAAGPVLGVSANSLLHRYRAPVFSQRSLPGAPSYRTTPRAHEMGSVRHQGSERVILRSSVHERRRDATCNGDRGGPLVKDQLAPFLLGSRSGSGSCPAGQNPTRIVNLTDAPVSDWVGAGPPRRRDGLPRD